jgi:hypothetical protein
VVTITGFYEAGALGRGKRGKRLWAQVCKVGNLAVFLLAGEILARLKTSVNFRQEKSQTEHHEVLRNVRSLPTYFGLLRTSRYRDPQQGTPNFLCKATKFRHNP